MTDDLPETQPISKELYEAVKSQLGKPTGDPVLDKLLYSCMMCDRDKRDESTKPCTYCKPRPRYPDVAPAVRRFRATALRSKATASRFEVTVRR